jgi:type I restriction enzyme S subunit
MSELPTGWSIRPVADIATFGRKKPAELRDSQEKVAFLPMAAVEEISGLIARDQTITHAAAQKKTLTFFEEGDILFAKVTPCMENGKIARATSLLGGCGYGSTEFHVIVPGPDIQPDYLRYFLVNDDFRSEAERAMTGAVGLRRVPKAFIEKYPIPVPPLDVQKRIVETLEDHLSRLDKALAEVEVARGRLAQQRRALLRDAFDGRLTGEPGPQRLNPKRVRLEDIVAPRASKANPADYPEASYIGLEDVRRDSGELLSTVSASTMKSSSAVVSSGDVLYGRLRPYLNKVHLAQQDYLASSEFIVFPPSLNVSSKYLSHLLRSPDFLAFTAMLDTGDRPRVNWNGIKNFMFDLPPLDVQQRIVETLEDHLSRLDRTAETLDAIEKSANTLRRSLLHAAFTGQLTNEEPND